MHGNRSQVFTQTLVSSSFHCHLLFVPRDIFCITTCHDFFCLYKHVLSGPGVIILLLSAPQNNLAIVGSSWNKEYSGNNQKEFWERSVCHMHAYTKMASQSQTQALMHSAQLQAEEPPRSSPSNISFLVWLCTPIPSDLARPCNWSACGQEVALCSITFLRTMRTWMGIMVDPVKITALVQGEKGIE